MSVKTKFAQNGGGMRSWGFRDDETIPRYKLCQRAMH